MSRIRRLAAIIAADVAGYSRLMGADEEGTRLKALREDCLGIRTCDALVLDGPMTSYITSQNEPGDELAGSGSKGPI